MYYVPSSEINVYPSNSKSLGFLIDDTMMSTLLKGSDCSIENTDHSEMLKFEELPNILFGIVNRYGFDSSVNKN